MKSFINNSSAAYQSDSSTSTPADSFDEKLLALSPSEQEAVKKFWRYVGPSISSLYCLAVILKLIS